jgi:hypothetical protein
LTNGTPAYFLMTSLPASTASGRRKRCGGAIGLAAASPLRHLREPDFVLDRVLVDGNRELVHRAWRCRADVIFPHLRYGDGNRLIQAFGLDIDAMENAVGINKGDAAAGSCL